MEGDSHTSTSLEWENLALYSGRPMHQIPQHLGFSSPVTSAALLGTCSSSKFPAPSSSSSSYEDLMNVACSPEPMIGLRLGHHKEYGDGSSRAPSMPTPTPTKRSRASYHSIQNPCCQVEGCNLDLKLAKDYHRRHRICETHSKSPKVIVAGLERRFCQQCSRFHDLSEFDDKKRSCRRRLSDHNARRRRVQPESVQLTSPGLSPALYDQRQQNVLLSGLPVSLPNSRWETSMSRQALHMDLPSIHRSNARILDQCVQVGSTHSSMAPDMVSAHSLLSSTTWSMNNEGESNYSPMMRHQSEPHQFHTNHHIHEGPPISLHDAAPSHHHQEYHLFNDSATSYYPTHHQRNL